MTQKYAFFQSDTIESYRTFLFLFFSCKKEQETPILTYDDLLLLNSRFECITPTFEPSTYFKGKIGEAPHENKEGLGIYIFTHESIGQSKALLSTMAGKQKANNYIKVKKAEKGVVFGKTYYDIVLEIKCDLYKQWEENPQFYATLEGEYAT